MPTVLSPAELDALRAELAGPAYAGLDAAARLDRLHAPEPVPNPAPRGQVPKPFAALDLVNACSAANRPNLGAVLSGAAAQLILMQDRGHLSAGLDALAAIGTITVADADAMKAVLAATVPDPAYRATVPGPTPKQRLFGARTWTYPDGRVVNYIPPDDVEAAS